MNILLEINAKLPTFLYGGTERVVWSLAHALNAKGHRVYLLAQKGTVCPVATVIERDFNTPIEQQIPENVDIVHFHGGLTDYSAINKPFIVTQHGNSEETTAPKENIVYVSHNHAQRHQSSHFVYNGLLWDEYLSPDLSDNWHGEHYHFLGKAAWRAKNVRGAIRIIDALKNEKLMVLGGHRLNFKMGFRFTLSRNTHFCGMVGGKEKMSVMAKSKGLIFPVLWDEPFGLAMTESLYMGAPVFGTLRGSLPELIAKEVGFLSESEGELVDAIRAADFSRRHCHEYARDVFNADVMAEGYLKKYEQVINYGKLDKF